MNIEEERKFEGSGISLFVFICDTPTQSQHLIFLELLENLHLIEKFLQELSFHCKSFMEIWIKCWNYLDIIVYFLPVHILILRGFSILFRGGYRVLVRGVRGDELSEAKFFGTPLSIFGIFTGGWQPLIHKHINRGLTYDSLIVIYHLLSGL